MWNAVTQDIPEDRDLRLAVIEGEVHALAFPCRRKGDAWIEAATGRRIEVHPTHYQDWHEGPPA